MEDVLIVCNPAQIKTRCIEGAPSVIIEILLPTTARYDQFEKLNLYAKYGVAEYWLITPHPAMIQVLLLDGKTYRLEPAFSDRETLTTPSFPELSIPLKPIFDFPPDPEQDFELIKEGRPDYGTASNL